MRGRARILLGVLILLLCWSVVSAKQRDYTMPTIEKLLRPGLTVVKYDRTAYNFYSNDVIVISFTQLNDRYIQLKVDPLQPVPTTIVTLWWDSFPFNTLVIESGDDNTWTLDSETGYAEK